MGCRLTRAKVSAGVWCGWMRRRVQTWLHGFEIYRLTNQAGSDERRMFFCELQVRRREKIPDVFILIFQKITKNKHVFINYI